ncbi:MAG: hypothetical protein P8L85_04435 [Rubripirellula sp.]|nr:hypothetical protein [Rubripirellula sp.]
MNFRFLGSIAILTLVFTSQCLAKGRTVARIFWQDDSDATVRCGDLKKSSDGWSIANLAIDGFPKLDSGEQSLVQMQTHQGLVIVGVRDRQEGSVASGWVAIESGVVEESHGDHSHFQFKNRPEILHSLIDSDQGNPAHVYKYGELFAIANDKKNGFTLTSTRRIRDAKLAGDAASFLEGGNGHITLAVAPGQVAYATWIAPSGADQGRVDVVGLGKNRGESYSFHCPSGRLHGAAMNSGKAFFAPADGVCWVAVDHELNKAPESVTVHHLSLGTDDDDEPMRTGAFVDQGRHLVFTAGKGPGTKLCWIDASADLPAVGSLPLDVPEGEKISTPRTMKSRYGDTLAVMFGQHKESPNDDRMLIVNLDPNRDGSFEDAKISQTIDVGPNQMVGHSGYHAATMLPDGRHAVITNPGDGSLWVISLNNFNVIAKLNLNGTPTRLLAIGG